MLENKLSVYCVKYAESILSENMVYDGGSKDKQIPIIEYAVSQIGSDRFLFGTDTYSAASQRGRIEFSMIKEKDKENILVNNAKRLFKL